jgi:acyl carrier protein
MNHKKEIQDFVVGNFLFGDASRLQDEASFLDTGIVDSAGILELINFLESTYAIRIEGDEMLPDNLDSINRVTSFLQRKLASATQPVGTGCAESKNASAV